MPQSDSQLEIEQCNRNYQLPEYSTLAFVFDHKNDTRGKMSSSILKPGTFLYFNLNEIKKSPEESTKESGF